MFFKVWHQWFGCESYPKSWCVLHSQGKPSEFRHRQAQQGKVLAWDWGYGCCIALECNIEKRLLFAVVWLFVCLLVCCSGSLCEQTILDQARATSLPESAASFPFTNHWATLTIHSTYNVKHWDLKQTCYRLGTERTVCKHSMLMWTNTEQDVNTAWTQLYV